MSIDVGKRTLSQALLMIAVGSVISLSLLVLGVITPGCDEDEPAADAAKPPGDAKLAGFVPGWLTVCAVVDGDAATAHVSYWSEPFPVTLKRTPKGMCGGLLYDWPHMGLESVLSITIDAGEKKPSEVGVYYVESPTSNPGPDDFKYARAVQHGDAYRLRIDAQAPALPVVKVNVGKLK